MKNESLQRLSIAVWACLVFCVSSTSLLAGPADDIKQGLKFDNAGQLDKAIECYHKAINSGGLSPKNFGIAYFNLGVVHKKKEEYKKALRNYSKAIEYSPDFAMAYNNRGMIYDIWEQHDKAIADYCKSIELNNDPEALEYSYNNRGFAYYNIGKLKEAENDLLKAIKLNPEYAMSYNNLGLIFSERGNYKKASECYQKAIDLDNDKEAKLYACDNTGLNLGAQGKFKDAIESHSQALKVKPDDAYAVRNKARAHFYNNDSSTAQMEMKKARKLEPYGKYTAIWSYIISGCDERNKGFLEDFAGKMKDDKWPAEAIKLFIGKSSPDKCLKAAASKNSKKTEEQQCEACFYIGKYYQAKGDMKKAKEFYLKCIECGRYYIPEVFSAKTELEKMSNDSI